MHIIIIAIGTFLVLIPCALIWYINAGGIRAAIRDRKELIAKRIASTLLCTLDTDCPAGYICSEGRCLPATK
ncbi:MAG: hypothetical protein A2144_10400 [Chloroflexi bacterium RBG_16_50_9]|nr:MAG: hypothetical protein A2144_10400 [Chloroflexi bacterium RBG_16_50_9]